MSVGREFGQTIAACRTLDRRLASAGFAIPFRMIVDIDHGDVTSSNPDDTDPMPGRRHSRRNRRSSTSSSPP
jgi:hypothetical protein